MCVPLLRMPFSFVALSWQVVFVNIMKRLNCRALVIVHRKELVQQAVNQIKRWWPDVEVRTLTGL